MTRKRRGRWLLWISPQGGLFSGMALAGLIAVALAVLFAFCLVFVGLRAASFATFVVTGGSMEPTIHKGSLVIDQPVTADKLKLGDVITYDHADQTTTHRIVGIEGSATTCPTSATAANFPNLVSIGNVTSYQLSGTSKKQYCGYLQTQDAAGNLSLASNIASNTAR